MKLFTGTPQQDNPENKPASPWILNWFTLSALLAMATLVIVLLFGASKSAKATIFIWMMACLVASAAIGFLFGIPKILQANRIVQGAEDNAATGTTDRRRLAYQQQVNTNLTEISDWLTKIIVGLGLVNLSKISPKIAVLANIMGSALESGNGTATPLSLAFAYGTIISYTSLGFLLGYITTRLYLAILFSKADQEAMALDEVTRKADEAVGAAQSALRKADFAVLQPAAAISSGERGAMDTPAQHANLETLITEYNEVRRTMKPSDARTVRMTKIVSQMAALMKNISDFDVTEALRSGDKGTRLSGIVFLFVNPDYEMIGELINTLLTDPTPFGQYWAIQALGSIRALRPDQGLAAPLFEKLKAYYTKLPDGIDRKFELGRVVPELKTT